MSRLAELAARARSEGIGAVASLVLATLRDRIAPPWHLVYWTPTDAPVAATGADARATAPLDARTWDGADEAVAARDALAAVGLPTDDAAELEGRMRAGARVHVVLVDGRFAGSMYTVPGARRVFQHLVLTARDAMVLDARIVPAYRGRGLYARLLAESLRALRAVGIERLYIDTPENNVRSLATFKRLGFTFLLRYRARGGRYRYDAAPL